MPFAKGEMVQYKIDVTLSYFIKRGSGGTEYTEIDLSSS